MHVQLSSGTRGLQFGLNIHILPCFEILGFGKRLCLHRLMLAAYLIRAKASWACSLSECIMRCFKWELHRVKGLCLIGQTGENGDSATPQWLYFLMLWDLYWTYPAAMLLYPGTHIFCHELYCPLQTKNTNINSRVLLFQWHHSHICTEHK